MTHTLSQSARCSTQYSSTEKISQLSVLAVDLFVAPASQAFVERLFSVCGMLSSGRRNRMEKSLEMSLVEVNFSVLCELECKKTWNE